METTFCCHSCGTEVTAFALRCPTCYVALREASRAPAPLRAGASQRAGGQLALIHQPQVLATALPPGPLPDCASPVAPSPRAVQYATWGQRATASLIDASVPVVGLLVSFIALSTSDSTVGLLPVMAATVFYIWHVFFRQGKTGQSLGKAQVGISLRRESDLAPVGVGMNTVRHLAHGLDALVFGLGFFRPLWDNRRQTLADKVCGTSVIVI